MFQRIPHYVPLKEYGTFEYSMAKIVEQHVPCEGPSDHAGRAIVQCCQEVFVWNIPCEQCILGQHSEHDAPVCPN
jgi:hypothetical protein